MWVLGYPCTSWELWSPGLGAVSGHREAGSLRGVVMGALSGPWLAEVYVGYKLARALHGTAVSCQDSEPCAPRLQAIWSGEGKGT